LESSSGQMDRTIEGSGAKTRQTGLGFYSRQLGTYTRGTGKTVNRTDMEYIAMRMGLPMLVNGIKTSNMAMA
jgi:hypothetical protein